MCCVRHGAVFVDFRGRYWRRTFLLMKKWPLGHVMTRSDNVPLFFFLARILVRTDLDGASLPCRAVSVSAAPQASRRAACCARHPWVIP